MVEEKEQEREELDMLHQQVVMSLLIMDTISGVLIECVSGSYAYVSLSVRVCAAGRAGCQKEEEGLAAEATCTYVT